MINFKFNVDPEIRKVVPFGLILVFILFASVMIAVGVFYYESQKRRVTQEQSNELIAVSKLKVRQISQWFREREGDAGVIMENLPLMSDIKGFYDNPQNKDAESRILLWMKGMRRMYDYNNLLLVDSLLNVKLTLDTSDVDIKKEIEELVTQSIRTGKFIFSDLHRVDSISKIHLDVIVPLFYLKNHIKETFGAAILRLDPDKTLYPLIKEWPTSSKSSETLIVKADNDSVVFLNELRHRSGTALKIKRPANDSMLPAAMAVRGDTGLINGVDYRGVQVTGYLQNVPGTNWFMVTKTDKSELYSPLKRYFTISVVVTALLLLFTASIFFVGLWNLRIKFYREKLVAELEKSALKEHFEYLVKYANDIFILTDKNYIIREVNDKALSVYGFKRDEMIGLDSLRLSASEVKSLAESRRLILNDQGSAIYETIHVKKDGTQFPIEISSRMMEIGGEKFYQAIIRDITERKNSEKALKESELRLRQTLDKMLEGCQILDHDWRYVYINEAAEKHNRRSNSELLGNIYQEMWPGIESTNVFRLLKKCMDNRETNFLENEFIFPDGTSGWFDLRIQQVPEGILILSDDITARKLNEIAVIKLNEELEQRVIDRTQQLAEANHELEAFTYSVSHDLRSPLRSVHSFTNILLEEYSGKLDEEGRRICSIISSSAVQMGGLIDDLLNLSRVGRSALIPVIVDMKAMATAVFTELTTEAEKGTISFQIENLPNVKADFNLIRLVWTNLISNAVKYSSSVQYPQISVGAVVDEKYYTFFIKDNGVGFDMNYVGKLFGVFQRLHSFDEFEGNGVGLAIVHRIISRHDGKVWAEADVNKGAKFYFSLPV